MGFEACRIVRPDAVPEAGARLDRWLAAGSHGDMDWMADTAARRRGPRMLWPAVRSVVMLGTNYGPACDPRDALERRDRGAISVYARHRDYHDVIKGKTKLLASWLQRQAGPEGAQVKAFVDTAPVMEKPLAAAAGVGWQGKHTNLVSRDFGSWLFLASIFTTLELAVDAPMADHCGSCRACLEACPTAAFPSPYQLDARRCISYLTIEHQGVIAREFRAAMGNRIYGCDDCLAVCPWNKFASLGREAKLAARADRDDPDLASLAVLDDAGFRQRFAGSPIKRIGHVRFPAQRPDRHWQFRRSSPCRPRRRPSRASRRAGPGHGRLGGTAPAGDSAPASRPSRARDRPDRSGRMGRRMRLFVFGLGYTAGHYARQATGWTRIAGTVRSAEKAAELRGTGLEALIFDGDAAEPAVEPTLTASDALLVSVQPGQTGDPVLARFAAILAAAPALRTVVYLSTVGVFGDHGGAWIDERTTPVPESERGRARLAAERDWLALGARSGKSVQVLRLAGIYGPGRNALADLAAGEARRVVKPGQVFNRIHVADIGRAIDAAFAFGGGSRSVERRRRRARAGARCHRLRGRADGHRSPTVGHLRTGGAVADGAQLLRGQSPDRQPRSEGGTRRAARLPDLPGRPRRAVGHGRGRRESLIAPPGRTERAGFLAQRAGLWLPCGVVDASGCQPLPQP